MKTGSVKLGLFLVVWCFFAVLPAFAQNILDPAQSAATSPAITFELTWKQVDPQWYKIAVNENGTAQYESKAQSTEGQPDSDVYTLHFIMSQPTRTRIFQLAGALNDFNGNFETKAKVAQTGQKTLTYRNGTTENRTTLNYSDRPDMNELISIFQKISTTFEVAQKLDFDMRFDKLGLDRDLKSLVRLDSENQLAELQVIAPTLERIANDPSVMNIARQKARVLLDKSRPVASKGQK